MKFRVVLRKEGAPDETRIIEAASRIDAYKLVEQEGAKVTSLTEGAGFQMPAWLNISIGRAVKTADIVLMTKNLSAMLAAGLSLGRALSVIERQSSNPRLRTVVLALEESVKKGNSFHDALAEHPKMFSTLFIAMVRAGEESGSLGNALSVVGVQMDKSEVLIRKIRGAMIYPAIILVAIVIVGILMMIFVVPTLTATFVQLKVQVPLATRIITDVSNFMVANIVLVIGGIIALIVLGGFFVRSHFGRHIILVVALQLPVIGELVRETYTARVSRTLSSLLSSGVPVVEALAISQEVAGKTPFGAVLEEAQHAVEKGTQISTIFSAHAKLYPVLMSDMLAVGEETGTSAEMLKKVAEFYEADVEDRTKDLSTIIEPVLMLVIGTAVGIFAVSMIAPIYSLSSSYS